MSRNSPRQLEICVETTAGIAAAKAGGADRIELCGALVAGGITPSVGLMQAAAEAGLPAHVMIRPRSGHFRFDATEVTMMCHDIACVGTQGLAGVVIGATTQDGALCRTTMSQLIDAADGLYVTLHRAIDTLVDPVEGVAQAMDLGVQRILSSGGRAKALAGAEVLAAMAAAAGDAIEIMAGSGVTAENLAALYAVAGLNHYHASCRMPATAAADALGFGEADVWQTDSARVAALRATLDAL